MQVQNPICWRTNPPQTFVGMLQSVSQSARRVHTEQHHAEAPAVASAHFLLGWVHGARQQSPDEHINNAASVHRQQSAPSCVGLICLDCAVKPHACALNSNHTSKREVSGLFYLQWRAWLMCIDTFKTLISVCGVLFLDFLPQPTFCFSFHMVHPLWWWPFYSRHF